MRKKILYFISFLLLILSPPTILALDPVAPKSERAFGFLRVDTPLPLSDRCEIIGHGAMNQSMVLPCRPGEQMKVPIGAYLLKVELQQEEWSTPILIHPTEYTKLAVTGYGNLKVRSPHPMDSVEVFTEDGRLLERFPASQIRTLPVGVYKIKVYTSAMATIKPNVSIWPNATRELIVSF